MRVRLQDDTEDLRCSTDLPGLCKTHSSTQGCTTPVVGLVVFVLATTRFLFWMYKFDFTHLILVRLFSIDNLPVG